MAGAGGEVRARGKGQEARGKRQEARGKRQRDKEQGGAVISNLPLAPCSLPLASCLLPLALCPLPLAPCPLPLAPCLLPLALCPLPLASCPLPLPLALCPLPLPPSPCQFQIFCVVLEPANMELSEAITLIQPAHSGRPNAAIWADLGCGSGLFSFALAHLLAAGSKVYASDRDPVRRPQGIDIQPYQLDFVAQPLPWQALDGILMANSLHYVSDKKTLLARLMAALKPEGQLIIVEYDTDKPVPQWVPYPVSFRSLQKLFADTAFSKVEKAGERASVYGRAPMYAASVIRQISDL